MSTTFAKPSQLEPKWYVVDATGQTLGRLAVKIANVLRGRGKPIYTPFIDTGDYVIVINAEKVAVTGRKRQLKTYMFFSGWVGTEKHFTFEEMIARNPRKVIDMAVRRMVPQTRLGHQMMQKLKIYAGPEHPHAGQTPVPLA